ncbi:hypothetical protein Emag_002732 [Eimeria magna]
MGLKELRVSFGVAEVPPPGWTGTAKGPIPPHITNIPFSTDCASSASRSSSSRKQQAAAGGSRRQQAAAAGGSSSIVRAEALLFAAA